MVFRGFIFIPSFSRRQIQAGGRRFHSVGASQYEVDPIYGK
jgi:hypothetical protein